MWSLFWTPPPKRGTWPCPVVWHEHQHHFPLTTWVGALQQSPSSQLSWPPRLWRSCKARRAVASVNNTISLCSILPHTLSFSSLLGSCCSFLTSSSALLNSGDSVTPDMMLGVLETEAMAIQCLCLCGDDQGLLSEVCRALKLESGHQPDYLLPHCVRAPSLFQGPARDAATQPAPFSRFSRPLRKGSCAAFGPFPGLLRRTALPCKVLQQPPNESDCASHRVSRRSRLLVQPNTDFHAAPLDQTKPSDQLRPQHNVACFHRCRRASSAHGRHNHTWQADCPRRPQP